MATQKFTKLHASRLLTLAHFLKTQVKPKEFNLSSFVGGQHDFNSLFQLNTSCGTTACAIGWCPVVFPRQWKFTRGGLPLERSYTESRYHTFDWGEDFFGINRNDWNWLFGSRHIRTPKQEAKVIEQFVKEHGYIYA